MTETGWIILAGAIVTYLTRIGGHLLLSRLERVPPRLEAALDAVPAAVLATLVAPPLLAAHSLDIAAVVVAGLVALRSGVLTMFLAGAAALIGGHLLFG